METFKLQRSKTEDESATKKCGDCMAEIPQKAKKCQHCGTKQKEKIGLKHLFAIGLIVIILGAIFVFIGSDSSSPTAQKQSDHSTMAYVQAKNYVKTVLKSPSTADFPFLERTTRNLGNGRYEVSSYVDSQNSFGAEIRSNWTVTLQYTNGDSADQRNWQLEKLIVNGEVVYP